MPYSLEDISQKSAEHHLPLVNDIDNLRFDKFTYQEGVYNKHEYILRPGCLCVGECGIDPNCICVAQSSIRLISQRRIKNVGDLHDQLFKKKLFECGSKCACKGSCSQQVSFARLPWRLEVFRTQKAGFSVRTKEFLHKGTFICQLAGELMTPKEVAKFVDMDKDFLFTFKSDTIEDSTHLSIYCKARGNVSRFFNHSCLPNMFLMLFYTDQANPAWPNIGFVANRDIDEGEELTFFYGEQWLAELLQARKFCFCSSEYCVLPPPGTTLIEYEKVLQNARRKTHELKKKRKAIKAAQNTNDDCKSNHIEF